LKGSTKDREASTAEKSKASPVLLDNDFISIKRSLNFGDCKKPFMEQLTLDSLLLSRYNIMDYSLLVGVHYETDKNADDIGRRKDDFHEEEEALTCRSLFQQHDGCIAGVNPAESFRKEYYLIGIIDFLVQYSAKKKFENFFRGTIGGAGEGLSVVKPKLYSSRFLEFMTGKLLAEVPSAKAPKKASSARRTPEVKREKSEEKEVSEGKDKDKDRSSRDRSREKKAFATS